MPTIITQRTVIITNSTEEASPMKPVYHVNADHGRSYSSHNARDAAEVAHAYRRNGLAPELAVATDGGWACPAMGGSIRATARALVAAGR